MNLTKSLVSVTFLFLYTIPLVSAQKKDSLPVMNWGDFRLDDLKMKDWKGDTSVSAAILGDIGDIYMAEVRNYYGFVFKQHRQIKIFKKEGFEQANITIPYYAKDNTEFVKNIRAQTIGTNGMKYPVDNKAIVYEKLNDKTSVVKFTFPNVTEGSILEYEYELESISQLELKEWYFQGSLPRRFSRLNLDIWSRYEYMYLFQGQRYLKTTEPKHDKNEQRTSMTFYTKDLPGIKGEKFVTSYDNHLVRIRFQLSSYYDGNGVKKQVLSTWDKTAEDLLDSENIGKKYLKKGKYSKILDAAKGVVSETDAPKDVVQKLYDWVNKNIEWDGYYYLWSSETPNDLWQKRKAGSADINFILLALLKEARIDASPVLLSTRSHEAPYTEFPLIDQFNHAVILVDLGNNQKRLLDAGHPNLPIGYPSEEALNGKGWVLKAKDHQWIEIKPNMSSQILNAKFSLTEEGNFKGTISGVYRGYASVDQREMYNKDASGKKKIERLMAKNTDWQIDSLTNSNLEKTNEGLKETLKLTVANAAQVTDNMIYVKPALKSGWEVNPFKQEERMFPVEFPYPTSDQYSLNLVIPEGFKVEEMPKTLMLNMPNDDAKFTYQVGFSDKTVKIAMQINVNKSVFQPEEYKDLRKFFSQVSSKLEEMIVLKKVAK